MRALLIVLAVVALGAIAWFMTRDGGDAIVETPAAESGTTADVAEDAAEDVGEAAEAAGDAATGAAEAVTDTAEGAADAATDATEDVAPATDTAVEGSTDATGDATASAESSTTPEATDLEQALSAQTFDAAAIRDAIAASDLTDLQKQTAEALVTQAEQNPDTIQSVVDQLRTLLDL